MDRIAGHRLLPPALAGALLIWAQAGPATAQPADGAAIVPPEVVQQDRGAASPGVETARVLTADDGEDQPPARIVVEIETLELSVGRLALRITLDDDRADDLSEVLREFVEGTGIVPGGD